MEDIWGPYSLCKLSVFRKYTNPSRSDGIAPKDSGTGQNIWVVQCHNTVDGFGVCKFQNKKTRKYLRIYRNGKSLCIDAEGNEKDPGTKFKVHPVNDQYGNSFAFSSVHRQNKFISVNSKGNMVVSGVLLLILNLYIHATKPSFRSIQRTVSRILRMGQTNGLCILTTAAHCTNSFVKYIHLMYAQFHPICQNDDDEKTQKLKSNLQKDSRPHFLACDLAVKVAKAVKQVVDEMDQDEVKSNVQIDFSVASDFRYDYLNEVLNNCLEWTLSGSVWEAYWFEINGGGPGTVISLSIFILAADNNVKVNKCCTFRLCIRDFFRIHGYWCVRYLDNFYASDKSELPADISKYCQPEEIRFYLLRHQDQKTVPLYRYYTCHNPYDADCTLSISSDKGKIIGYCYELEDDGPDDLVPLYKYRKYKFKDIHEGGYLAHFYTTDASEIGANLKMGQKGKFGFRYEGIECYVFPPSYVMDVLER